MPSVVSSKWSIFETEPLTAMPLQLWRRVDASQRLIGSRGGHVSLVINWMWSCSLLKGRRTLRRDSEREREGKRWLWWRRMRCEIKVREIKSVRRLRDVFILEKCCLIKGICSQGRKCWGANPYQRRYGCSFSVLFSLIYKRDWKIMYFFYLALIGLGGAYEGYR